jgi:hypothetical protein
LAVLDDGRIKGCNAYDPLKLKLTKDSLSILQFNPNQPFQAETAAMFVPLLLFDMGCGRQVAISAPPFPEVMRGSRLTPGQPLVKVPDRFCSGH